MLSLARHSWNVPPTVCCRKVDHTGISTCYVPGRTTQDPSPCATVACSNRLPQSVKPYGIAEASAMSITESVTKAGTSAAALARATSNQFLIACLRKARLDAELHDDIAEACEMNDFTALSLGSGELSVKSTADKLFLMEDEAATLLSTCRNECGRAGVHFGDGAVYEPADELDDEPAPAPAAARPAPSAAPPAAQTTARTVYDHEEDVADDDGASHVLPDLTAAARSERFTVWNLLLSLALA